MSTKEIFGFLSVIPDKATEKVEVQAGNIFFKSVARRRAINFWDNNSNSTPYVRLQPWKMAALLTDDDETVGHSFIGDAAPITIYPQDPPSNNLNTLDYKKFRSTTLTTTIASTDIPRVIGAVGAYDGSGFVTTAWQSSDSMLSLNDVPLEYTQIGTVYQHPITVGGSDISTAVGASYVTFANTHYLDQVHVEAHAYNFLTIGSGADVGTYLVRYVDFNNNRLYLMNLDGSLFVGQATASSLPWYIGPGRRAYFNEVSILQLSAGLVVTGGTFRPGAARSSFILKVTFDKTGSDASAAGTEQQGRYYVSLKPYTHGNGLSAVAGTSLGLDTGRLQDTAMGAVGGVVPKGFNFFNGGAVFALDEVNQRVWFGYTDGSNQSGIGYWRWKTCEGFREIANYLGTGAHKTFVTPSLVLGAGDIIRDLRIGPAGIVYVAIGHATGGNGGIAVIHSDKTTLQYNTGSLIGVAASQVAGTALDSSRARVGTASDASTNGAAQVTSASGAFTNSDIGRAIKLTGLGADSGTYKISSVGGATTVNVTTLAGGAVTFTSQTGGTFEIGERLYLFFSNATTGAALINYMESLAPGTFLTRSVPSMTNGANCNVASRKGEDSKISIDPATGDIYWLSNDAQQQINKYEVLTNTHTYRTVANVQSPSGGTGTIGTITVFTAILVNPKFDEIWVGTDQGQVKLVKSAFAGANYKRYYGDVDGNYANPAGFFRPCGQWAGTAYYVRNFSLHPDGKVTSWLLTSSYTVHEAVYSREADLWNHKGTWGFYDQGQNNCTGNLVFDSLGNYLLLYPQASLAAQGQPMIMFGSTEVQYQWDNANSKWIPLEVYQGALPNKSATDTISPGCRTKAIHAAVEDVLYGVKIGFTKQGGATPANNEFLGRAGQTNLTLTDGATNGSTTFTGSGFVSGDVGKYLRIENSTTPADIGVYKVTVFGSSTSLTLTKLDGSTFAPGTASGIQYTLWSRGTPGSNAGPETATVLLADGFGKDNTQDISGITYETFHFKTVIQEDVEPTKFCVPNPIGAPGGTEMKVYYDFFPRVGTAVLASHDLQTTQIRALPGAEWTSGGFSGRKLVDGFVDAALNNAGARGSMHSSPTDGPIWYGTVAGSYGFLTPVSSNLGNCPMVDLGADAEVGYVIIRGDSVSGNGLTYNATYHGLKATLYKANGPTAPVASATSRTSGTTNLSLTINNTTITTTGDFLGGATTGPLSNGSTVSTEHTFTAPAATFVQGDVGKILKITALGDIGAYRIIAVDVTGAIATITNLDQTAKAWSSSISGITYAVHNGVREEDVICVPSIAAPTQRLCIERLLTPTTAQVRVPPHTSATTQSWQCAIPTWDKVKRVSHSTEAVPPDVKGNKTWVCDDGREQYDAADFKIYMDLTDLTTAQRTGRWWQIQMMPRGINATSGDWNYCTFEFYTPAGARLGVSQYTFSDNALQNADFLSQHVNRADFIQSSYLATGLAGFNGVADVGGANGDTVTLPSGTNKFLGFQVRRPFSDGVCTAGLGGLFASATAAFISSDSGRFLQIAAGANAGIYRISNVTGATTVVLTLPSGTAAPSFTGTSGEVFTLFEGIAVGGANPDRLVFLDNPSHEYSIATINDALTTITILESRQPVMTGKQWEIRRPAFDTSSATTDSTKLARLVRPQTTYPLQPGDVAHDSRGALRFWADDIGTGNSRSDGAVAGGDGVFTGSGFCKDDEGRLLYITTGVAANLGIWRILTYTSATSITVVNAYTGAAVVFSADAVANKVYKIYGDRRFKITRHVTTLRA